MTGSTNQSWPRITVVTPSYQQADFLEATLRSVLEQDYPNLQYGVVDGGSTDGSADIIERYRGRLDFAIIEPDDGQTHAINKGLRLADGDIVCYLNSDDTFMPGALHTVGRFFRDHPDEHWLMGDCLFIDSGGAFCSDPEFGRSRMVATALEGLSHALIRDRDFCMPQPSIFWRRSLTDRLGLFDETLQYTFDYEMWCRFLADGHTPTVIHEALSTYRLHTASKTCALRHKMLSDHITVEARYANQLPVADRIRLMRSVDYRRRQLLALTADSRLRVSQQIIRRPWWLMSPRVRRLWLDPKPLGAAA